MPEEGSLSGELSVYEQMCFYGGLRGMTEEQVQTALIYWLDKFNIVDYLNRKITKIPNIKIIFISFCNQIPTKNIFI